MVVQGVIGQNTKIRGGREDLFIAKCFMTSKEGNQVAVLLFNSYLTSYGSLKVTVEIKFIWVRNSGIFIHMPFGYSSLALIINIKILHKYM